MTVTATSIERKARVKLPAMLRRRPRVRAECVDGFRPCPWLSCRHHLGADVLPSGALKEPHGHEWMAGEVPTCSLDLADQGVQPLAVVGKALGVKLVRVGQLERDAFAHLYAGGDLEGVATAMWERSDVGDDGGED